MVDIAQLMDGILLGECPRWHDGKLWFADWVGQKLYTLAPGGQPQVEATIASLPFSFDWLPDGRMLLVHAADNDLKVRQADGSFSRFADLSLLSEFGCNEITVHPAGHIYVNNINFNFPGGEFKPGFIALVLPDGTARIVADGLAFPNGMAILPDGRTLVCAESFNGNLSAFDIAPDGSLSNRRLWANVGQYGNDGICTDAEGAIWTSTGPTVLRVRDGGEVVERFDLDRMCFAVMLGGEDGRTLYMVANEWTGTVDVTAPTGRVFSTYVSVPHAGYP
ncbi:MAG: SMP-30/gluconolactonase/LRE family protein [Alphaproteobacteria bacterium]|nr:MAG: SMP-30/gluconolactonase/LRE family protein [Alphaproteobacteria bacterium]